MGFNGELREARIGWYLLGNGYRAYNPILMRFHSPDSWSPFGRGGLNAYMYCVGDPVNFSDPTGHMRWRFWRARTTGASSPPHSPPTLRNTTATLNVRRTLESRGLAPVSRNEYAAVPTASSSTATPISAGGATSSPSSHVSSSVERNRSMGLPDNYRSWVPPRSPEPETIPWSRYLEEIARTPHGPSGRSSTPANAMFASNPGPSRRPLQWHDAGRDAQGVDRIVLRPGPPPPPVPDRLLPNYNMRRADGSTYFDIEAAKEQIRGGKRIRE
ncbi:RHS repeat-associated core domain-containing protein [Pseudomonas fluorescens]|uniref:RHS repeat-associated core domain-containing protein n=1 Tax=Pseudomonas fluorescens TaxID=294 RepID=UPI0021E52666|nr:RHS repeat-associated core domain-containing protein [Pseudomonas fluorescens]